jgi:hypothetical protein
MSNPIYKIVREVNEETGDKGDFYLQITEGEFTGVTFNFGEIQFIGEDDEGSGIVNFDYTVYDSPFDLTESIESLEAVLGGVLQDVLIILAEADVEGTEEDS